MSSAFQGALAPTLGARLSRLLPSVLVAVLAVGLLAPSVAHAAACCLSASVFGIGRLAIWETAAMGIMTLVGHDTGRWDRDGMWRPFPAGYHQDEVRPDLWALVRLHERVQVFGRVPWVTGIRSATGVGRDVGMGLGDVQAGGRWDAFLAGEHAAVPAIALTGTLTGPTARRAEQATDALGASTTGRGAWVAGLAASVEKAVMPWFARFDIGATLPFGFTRADTGKTQRYGLGLQAAVSGGRELWKDKVVLGAQLLADTEAAYTIDGQAEPASGARGLNASLSLSWKLSPRWSLTGACASDAPAGWLGARNKTERWSATLGVRFAIQE